MYAGEMIFMLIALVRRVAVTTTLCMGYVPYHGGIITSVYFHDVNRRVSKHVL